ncbi:MAG: hypothetical protein IT385_02940 [Deltaproteobacteria bacterium]|nr:hypothetical protein [Deltaproteobacteria bacterium]
MGPERAVTRWLRRASPTAFSAYAIIAAFAVYFCMYAFRKPFTAGKFEGDAVDIGIGVLGLKALLIVSQVLGYTVSKFLGIKVVSELSGRNRALAVVVLILIAELALVLFSVTPAPWSAIWLFFNGLPLGMIWGLVFGFLEGRRTTEALGAGLSASYIVASGVVQAIGRYVMRDWGVSEEAMPFVVGALFFLPMVFFVWLLAQLPPPSDKDEALRTKRAPMMASDRSAFFKAFLPGLLPLVLLHFVLTAYRGVRDDFAPEIWGALGFDHEPAILATTQIPVALGVLVFLGLLMLVRDNRRAVLTVQGLMLGGSALVGLATLAFDAGLIAPEVWMIAVSLGLYVAYVPFGSMLFDRLIAATGWIGTAGFMIYVTDAVGYLGQVAVTSYRYLGAKDLSWLDFFRGLSYATSIVCVASFAIALVYFAKRARPRAAVAAVAPAEAAPPA